MTTADKPFILNDLPNGWWSVSWNKKQWRGIYTLASQIKLLELIFLEFGCFEAGFALRQNAWHEQDSDLTSTDIVYIKATACLQENGITNIASTLLYPDLIEGVCFPTQEEAERMLTWLEQKYLMKLLKADYGNDF